MFRKLGVAVVAAAVLVAAPSGHAASGPAEIYSVLPDGSDLVNLTNNGADDFSPSGSRRDGRIAFVSNRDGYDAIYVMNEDGSDQRRLTDFLTQGPHAPCHLYGPVWSPDSTLIAFTASCPSIYGDPRGIYNSIYVVPSSGGEVRELAADGANPAFSADGRFVAYSKRTNVIVPTSVWVVTTVGGASFQLGDGSAPAWSPSGHRLAFSWERHGLTVLDVSRPTRRWTFVPAGGGGWAPRGNLIAFWRDGGRPGIYLIRPGARRAERLADLGEGVFPYWAPDGRWLALNGFASTYIVRRDGRYLRRIGGTDYAAPVWSPDSSRVAWADPSADGLVVTKPRSDATVVSTAQRIYGIAWTRDSRRVVFSASTS